MKIVARSAEETKKMAALLAKEIIAKKLDLTRAPLELDLTGRALIVGLIGKLGSGKTTFAQGFAKGLGIKKNVLSPTFVLMRQYALKKKVFKTFIHIDCYRLDDQKELIPLGWRDLVKNPQNLILIEWADRVLSILPSSFIRITFNHLNETSRSITIA